jgi:hypothetical protein
LFLAGQQKHKVNIRFQGKITGAIILNAHTTRWGHRLRAAYLSPQWGHSKADNKICTKANALDYYSYSYKTIDMSKETVDENNNMWYGPSFTL